MHLVTFNYSFSFPLYCKRVMRTLISISDYAEKTAEHYRGTDIGQISNQLE